MRNVTITLDEETLRWARVQAARLDYGLAMCRYLSRKPVRLKESGNYPSREELHDRHHVH